jgi:mono/diheme cytochrome c family protein
VLLALTTEQQIGLAGTAAVFIVFALVSSFLIPRARPNYPGRGLGLFIVFTIVLTIAMLGAVEVFAVEEHHGSAAEPARLGPGERDEDESETTNTETEGTGTAPATTAQEGEEEQPAGDPAAGRAVFASSGCGSCHAFQAANAAGAVGPNLDESLGDKDAEYVERAIVDPNADVAQGYQPGIMPDYEDQLSEEQVDDLVAFLLES